MVSPPPDVGSRAAVAVPAANPSGASGTGRGAALPSGPASVDHADIRPLDLAGALQILVAEVRAALIDVLVADLAVPSRATQSPDSAAAENTTAAGNMAAAGNSAAVAHAEVFAAIASQDFDGPVPAARAMVDLVLRSLPETFEPDAWSALLPRVDLALQSGVQRALDAVSVWRDVPPAVVEGAQQSGNLALALSVDEPIYPWPPPEWLGMAPRLGRLWRRRCFLRRRLVDPDYGANGKWDDLNDPRP
jgi:hypothetical protein